MSYASALSKEFSVPKKKAPKPAKKKKPSMGGKKSPKPKVRY
jgi:hypothetical protein